MMLVVLQERSSQFNEACGTAGKVIALVVLQERSSH